MLVAEAYLVEGYAFTLIKNYAKAVEAFKKCIELCDARYVSREDFMSREAKDKESMRTYNEFQRKSLGLALRKPTPALLAQREAMTPEWENYDKEIRDFSVFRIDAMAQFSFKKSAVHLKKDAEYALATALHLIEVDKKSKIMDETKDKTKQIDKQMEELQKQLKETE
jgi:tetratricopeptide (TPR) repeat protein